MPVHHELTRGSLELMILSTLVEGPKYGYLISKRIEEVTGGRVKLPIGTLYRVVNELEKQEAIEGEWDGKSARDRKWYQLTAKGRQMLQQQSSEWQEYVTALTALLKPVQATFAADLTPGRRRIC